MPKHKESLAKDDDKPAFEDDAMGFVYKSLISRDPNKRRIKPVESILSYDLGLDDSESDDSDYNPGHLNEDGDSDGEAKETKKSETEQNGNQGDNSDSNSDDEDSDESIDEEDEDEEVNIGLAADSDLDTTSITNSTLAKTEQFLGSSASSQPAAAANSGTTTNSTVPAKESLQAQQSRLKKILVCCVCLGDVSRNDDEIVECDSCGISVHELCYGITADDSESVHSDASSCSTEPWFCDPCMANTTNPACELCPNSGGIFKYADTGRWVHMVCALYNGITFADVERLRGPELRSINFSRWGTKPCSLCEDGRFNNTGLVIGCDAGMCKTFFHATCAQREGLLCAQQLDEVDPYYAYCKMHADKQAAKLKRRNYLALQAKSRMLARDRAASGTNVEDHITSHRTMSKLLLQQQKFDRFFQPRSEPGEREKKIPKMLNSSPIVIRRLHNKGSMVGVDVPRLQQKLALDSIIDIRRKWYIPPTFSVEFVSYYMDRDERISSFTKQSQELIVQNKKLKEADARIRSKYDEAHATNEKLKAENDAKRAKIRRLLSILCSFVKEPTTEQETEGEKDSAESAVNGSGEDRRIRRLKIGRAILATPEMQTIKPKAHSANPPNAADSSVKNGHHHSAFNAYSLQHLIKSGSSKSKSKHPKHVSLPNETILVKQKCATCSLTKDQHSLALCDRCHLYYHLYCLDPPLRRMPKKTRFGGWQCSNCTEKDVEEEELMESALERAESASTPSVAESPGTVEGGGGGGATSTSSRGGTRKLRENPKSAVKYENELNSQLVIYPSGGLSGSGGGSASGSSRSRSRSSRPSATVASTTSSSSTSGSSSAAKSRKRGRTASLDNSTAAATATTSTSTSTSTSTTPSKTTPTPSEGKSGSSKKRKRDKAKDKRGSKEGTTAVASDNVNVEGESQQPAEAVAAGSDIAGTSSEAPVATEGVTTPSTEASSSTPAEAVAVQPTPVKSGQKRPVPVEPCNGCKEEAQPKQSVRCDCCMFLYHFGCLEPPLTKSPKRRGYTWCCYICEKTAEKRDHSHSHHGGEGADKSKASEKCSASAHAEQPAKAAAAAADGATVEVGTSASKDTGCAKENSGKEVVEEGKKGEGVAHGGEQKSKAKSADAKAPQPAEKAKPLKNGTLEKEESSSKSDEVKPETSTSNVASAIEDAVLKNCNSTSNEEQ